MSNWKRQTCPHCGETFELLPHHMRGCEFAPRAD